MFMAFHTHEEIARAEEVGQICLQQYIPVADTWHGVPRLEQCFMVMQFQSLEKLD
jgi:hypothetical protein